MWHFTFQFGSTAGSGSLMPPAMMLPMYLLQLAPALVAIASLAATTFFFFRLRNQDRDKLLAELMYRYVTLQADPHYLPVVTLIRDAAPPQLNELVALNPAVFPAKLEPHLRLISGKPHSVHDDKVKLEDPVEIAQVRQELFRICNATEAICAPFRLGLVSKTDFVKEFKHTLIRDDGSASLMNFISIRTTHYESIKYALKHIEAIDVPEKPDNTMNIANRG